MKITEFTKAITEHEGKKKNLDIAQISEVVRLVNEMTGGELYKMVKKMEFSPAPIVFGFTDILPKSKKTNGKANNKSTSTKKTNTKTGVRKK